MSIEDVTAVSNNDSVPPVDEPSSPGSLLDRAAAPVLYVPRLLLGAVGDIRSIAEATRTIASLAEYLAAIEARVESMDAEVRLMRQGVDKLHPEVTAMRESVEPLEGHLRGVGSLARIAARLPGGRTKGRRDGAGPDSDPIEEAAAVEDLDADSG